MPISLTPEEFTVLSDRDFMPRKQQVCLKVEQLLGDLQQRLEPAVQTQAGVLPAAVAQTPGKLSKGENYQSYAYRLLDYPRVFSGEDMFNFRSMMLWGHPFGFHLMLAGQYREALLPQLLARRGLLDEGFLLSAQPQPWIWEPQPTQQPVFAQLDDETALRLTGERAFFKLSVYLPLARWAELPAFGLEVWQKLLPLLV
jgi:hypothetical protein